MTKMSKYLPIDESLREYQNHKRDYDLKDPFAVRIRQFVGWLHNYYEGAVFLTQDMLDDWATRHPAEAWNSYANRLSAVRSFLKYWEDRGYGPYEVPDAKKRKEYPHYIHMEKEDVALFFRRVDELSDNRLKEAEKYDKSSYRYIQNMVSSLTMPVSSRLLYSSGMRCTEIRLLKTSSADLSEGVIHIHTDETKGYVERLVAVHKSLMPLLVEYDARMQEIVPDREFFFANACGGSLSAWWYLHLFRTCWPGDSRIVQTGFRHNYAIENVIRMDASSPLEMYLLSKAMGHTSLKRTKYYLHLTPAFYDILVRPELSLHLKDENEK